MAFSGDIDSALVAKLLADTGPGGLMTMTTDGIWWDQSSLGKKKFVVVKLMAHSVTEMYHGEAFEEPVYLVKAVASGDSGMNVQAAGARIDALLNGGSMTVTGYGTVYLTRDEYVHYAEGDSSNPANRWQHYGGMYSVTAAKA